MRDRANQRKRERKRERGRAAKGTSERKKKLQSKTVDTRAFPNCCQHSVTNFLNINRLLSVLVTVAAAAAREGAAEGAATAAECAKSSRN